MQLEVIIITKTIQWNYVLSGKLKLISNLKERKRSQY